MQITQYCSISQYGVFLNGIQTRTNDNIPVEKLFAELYSENNIQYPKFFKMDKLSQLGFLTSELLLQNAPEIKELNPYEIGAVLSNHYSSLNTDLLFWQSEQEKIASPSLFVYTLPNVVNAEICIRNKFKGENHFLVSEEFDAELLYDNISTLFAETNLKACIGGWIDILNENYHSVMFMVEKDANHTNSIPFTIENINMINEHQKQTN